MGRKEEQRKAGRQARSRRFYRNIFIGLSGIALLGAAYLGFGSRDPTFDDARADKGKRYAHVEYLERKLGRPEYVEDVEYTPVITGKVIDPQDPRNLLSGKIYAAVKGFDPKTLGQRKKYRIEVSDEIYNDQSVKSGKHIENIIRHEFVHAENYHLGRTRPHDFALKSNPFKKYDATLFVDLLELEAYEKQIDEAREIGLDETWVDNQVVKYMVYYCDLLRRDHDDALQNPQILTGYREKFFRPEFLDLKFELNGKIVDFVIGDLFIRRHDGQFIALPEHMRKYISGLRKGLLKKKAG